MSVTSDSPGHSVRIIGYLAISALLSLSIWSLLLLPDFLASKGWSAQKIGWAMGSLFLVHLIVQIFSGHLAERYGNVPTALLGSAIAILGGLGYLLTLWWLDAIFLARILHGAGLGMVSASAMIQLIKSVPMELRGRMIGYFGLPGFIMLGGGPALAEQFVSLAGHEGLFLCIIPIFLLTALILLQLPRPLSTEGPRAESFTEAFRANFPRLKSFLAFSFTFGLSTSVWQSFLAPAVSHLGTGAVSAFGLGYGTGAVLTRLSISQKLDNGRRRLFAIATLIVYGFVIGLVPRADSSWELGLIGVVCGMGHGIYYPSLSSIAAQRFHPLHTGQGMSLYISASSLGMFLGAPLWGSLADRLGYDWIFACAGLVIVLATILFLGARLLEYRRFGEPAELAVD